jgi:hypothetical protein
VADLKRRNNESFFIKSSREADMIKNLLTKFEGYFPKPALINIWRQIITASNMVEQPLQIAIHNPSNISDYIYITKEYYNNSVPLKVFSSTAGIISEIEKKEAQIGIFALPKEGESGDDIGDNWWVSLANNKLGLKVFAKLPLVEFTDKTNDHNKIQLVAVAIKTAEKSLEDNSLLYLEASKETTKSQILNCLKEQNLEGKILKSTKLRQVDGIVFHLVELSGFYEEEDAAIKNLGKTKIKPYAKILGHYPKPIVI